MKLRMLLNLGKVDAAKLGLDPLKATEGAVLDVDEDEVDEEGAEVGKQKCETLLKRGWAQLVDDNKKRPSRVETPSE